MRISVVMPSFNQGRFIREAIESVLQFSHLDVDLFVMDGGSTDETVAVLESFGDLIGWVSEPDDGQSWAINEGLNNATGDILCWLNSDDAFEEGALDQVLAAFEANPSTHFVYGRGLNIAEDGTPIGDSGVEEFTLWELIHRRNFLHQPSCFWTREAWHNHGGLVEDLEYVMDWDLWIRLGALPTTFLDVSLSKNRAYDDNKTMSGGFARWKEIRKICATRASTSRPDVLKIYGYEASIQKLRAAGFGAGLRTSLNRRFMAEMNDRSATGRLDNNAITNDVKLTVGLLGKSDVDIELTLVPLSTIDASLRESVDFTWQSHCGDAGSFTLDASVREPQTFRIHLTRPAEFLHLRLQTTHGGVGLAGEPSIVAYLEHARPASCQSEVPSES